MTQTTGPGTQPEETLGALIATASRDLSTLVRSEVELAKSELREDLKTGATGGAMFGAAAFLALLAVVLLSIALAQGLIQRGVVAWLAYLIVAVLYLLIAGLLIFVGKKKVAEAAARRSGRSARARTPRPSSRARCRRRPPGSPTRVARRRGVSDDRCAPTDRAEQPPDASVARVAGPWEHHMVAANGARFHVAVAGDRAAGAAAARLPAVLVDLAAPAAGSRRRRLPGRRDGPARLRRQRQTAPRLRPARPSPRTRPA